MVNQGCIFGAVHLVFGRHVARLRRRRRRRRAYAPTSNTASHDNDEKSTHGLSFLSHDEYEAPLGGPSGRRSYAIKYIENNTWARGDVEFIFECSHRYRTSERSERVRYRSNVNTRR